MTFNEAKEYVRKLLVAKKPSGWVPKKTLAKNEYAEIMGKATQYDYQKLPNKTLHTDTC